MNLCTISIACRCYLNILNEAMKHLKIQLTCTKNINGGKEMVGAKSLKLWQKLSCVLLFKVFKIVKTCLNRAAIFSKSKPEVMHMVEMVYLIFLLCSASEKDKILFIPLSSVSAKLYKMSNNLWKLPGTCSTLARCLQWWPLSGCSWVFVLTIFLIL